jgi:hypothetical protein
MPLPLLALAGYGTSLLVTAAIAALHAGRVVVPRVAEWEEAPGVWLHPDLGHLYVHLVRAVAEWEALGHDLGAVVYGGPSAGCGIRIEPRPLDRVRAGTLASAAVSAEFDEDPAPETPEDDHDIDWPEGVIRSATIYVDPLDCDARVLAHELGHALGYLHCTARLRRADASRGVQVPKAGHLMHPRYDEGGWSTVGLEADALGSAHERRMERRRERERRRAR